MHASFDTKYILIIDDVWTNMTFLYDNEAILTQIALMNSPDTRSIRRNPERSRGIMHMIIASLCTLGIVLAQLCGLLSPCVDTILKG